MEKPKEATGVVKEYAYSDSNNSNPNPILKELLPTYKQHVHGESKSETVHSTSNESQDNLTPGNGIVTVGSIPYGVTDKECMYLGHTTIQKIIDEASL